MTTRRVAIIGGGMGRYGLLPAFLMNSNVEVIAVCTSRKATAEAFASQYNIPKAYDSWQKLLQEKVDLLAIATPPTVQAEITSAALEKKIPLFLEKQIATNLSQSQKLHDLATQNRVPTCVNFIFPSLHTWRLMRTYVQENKLGQIRQLFLNWRMESYDNCKRTPDIWKTNDKQGGGVLQHFLSHSFHYVENLFGKIEEMRCTLCPAADLRVEGSTFASLDLIFESKLIGHVAASSCAYAGIGHTLEVYGSEGSLILKNEIKDPVLGFKLYYAPRGKPLELVDSEADHYAKTLPDSRIWPTSTLVDAFISSLDGGAIVHPTIDEAHRVQQLLDVAHRAHLQRDFIKVRKSV